MSTDSFVDLAAKLGCWPEEPPPSDRIAGEMLEQQRSDPLRHLVRCIVAEAGESLEPVGRGE